MRRTLALLLSCALVVPCGAGEALAAGTSGEATQDENILVEVRVDQLILSDALSARAAPGGGLRLPLGEFAQALGIAVTVDAAKGTAQGFVLHEERKFSLDLAQGLVISGGSQLPFDAAMIERRPDDLYVDMRLIARWFPVSLTYDPFALLVRVSPLEPLPAQARLERERRAEQGGQAPANPKFPFVTTPYAWLGDPSIDPAFGLTFSRGGDGALHPGVSYGALIDTDLLGLNAAGYFAGTDTAPLQDWHLTVGRKDPDGGLLGPLAAREGSAGYVFDPGLPLVSGAWNGYGGLVSSFPLTQPAHFDRQSLHGPLPSGWDAQLFQNNFPIAYQGPGGGGEYRFDDVPLVVGPNEFRIVLNGPQGQRREEIRRVNIGATLTPPGERRYRVLSGQDLKGLNRTSAEVEQGFSGQLSGAAGIASLASTSGGPARQYGQAGLRGTVGEVFWHADGAAATDGGLGTELGAQATAGLLGVSVTQALLRGFTSDEFRATDDPVWARSSGRFDARTPDEAWVPSSFALTAQLDRRASGLWAPTLGNQLSSRFGAFTATNVLSWDPSAAGAFSDATFELGARVGELDLRGQATYSPSAVQVLALIGSGQVWSQTRWTAAASYQLAAQQPQLTLDVNRTFDQLVAGVTVAVAYPWAVTGGVNLSAGLGLLTGGLMTSGQSQATTGTAVVHAFLDTNRNGLMDPGERPIPGIHLDVGGQAVTTDAAGRATVHGLAAYMPVDADFSKVALDDPLLVPALKGSRFVPRPGRATDLYLPIVAVGEVYGTVHVDDHGQRREQSGATLELVDAQDRVVATVVAGLDGYFALTEVPPGRYKLRVAADQLEKLGMRPAPARELVVPGEGAVLDGQDFTLIPKL